MLITRLWEGYALGQVRDAQVTLRQACEEGVAAPAVDEKQASPGATAFPRSLARLGSLLSTTNRRVDCPLHLLQLLAACSC